MEDLIKQFEGKDVMVINTTRGVLFKVNDFLKILDYVDIKDARKRHMRDMVQLHELTMKGGVKRPPLHPSTLFTTKDDLIRAAINSKLPEAIKFEKWAIAVINEVLDTGSYIEPNANKAEVLEKVQAMKATRHSIDTMFRQIVDLAHETLQEHYTRKGTTAFVAQVMDAVYQVSLLKTASYIKYEQIMAGGELNLVTTNQLRDKEAEWRIDFTNAINYMSDDDLEQVMLTMQELKAPLDGMKKRRFVTPTVKLVKESFAMTLIRIFDMIPDETKQEHANQLVHFKGIKPLLDKISKRFDKQVSKSDQDKVQQLETRKAPFMN